jgi:hypothetical protein
MNQTNNPSGHRSRKSSRCFRPAAPSSITFQFPPPGRGSNHQRRRRFLWPYLTVKNGGPRLDHNAEFILKPDAILVLPTLAKGHRSLNELLEDTGDVATCDVLEGVSTQRPSYWRQVKEVHPGDYRLTSGDGASRIEPVNTTGESQPPGCASVGDRPPDLPAGKVWRPCVSQTFDVGTAEISICLPKGEEFGAITAVLERPSETRGRSGRPDSGDRSPRKRVPTFSDLRGIERA